MIEGYSDHAANERTFLAWVRAGMAVIAFPVAPNLLNQNFNAAGPNQKWGADISYVWTREGWLYPRMCATRRLRILAANIGPNRFHQNRTVSWLMSIPRSANRSSTLRNDSGYRTYIITTRRMTSGELLKYRNGLLMIRKQLPP